ncbi:hypothetical protein TYRP_020844, partial [Tyrophagus putrescentiae]
MLRVILLLCFALASCQQATAVWPFASGERSSSSNVDYTNTINSAISSLPNYISYVSSQQQSAQPQLLNTDGEVVASTGHLGTTTEVKPSGVVSHGVKGVTRYPTQSKGTSQQPVQQLQDIFSSQPANIFGDGYLEPVVVGGSSSPSNQPSAPKRSWPWFFKQPSRKTSGQQATSANCFCIPNGLQTTTLNQPHLYQTEQQQPQQQTQHQQHTQSQYSNEESSAFGN